MSGGKYIKLSARMFLVGDAYALVALKTMIDRPNPDTSKFGHPWFGT
jgi:hypothetical protein